jgi:hypothetical protein
MATVTKGKTFINGELVTPEKLHQLVDAATVTAIATADISNNAITTAKIADSNVTTAKLADSAITSAKIADGTIVNADISTTADIALSKLATGALPTAITVASANIVDGTIVNADISATAAIADTKLAQITTAGKVLPAAVQGTAVITTDSRLSDARTPTSHTHGNITNAGTIGATSGVPIITGNSGVLQAGSFGTAAGTYCQGNDSRLSDARTPTAHTHAASDITTGTLANARTTATSANTANAIVTRDASGNFSAGIITASLTGNAFTATTLQTARTINGVSFNGSSNITVTAAPTAHTHSAADITTGTLAIARIPTGETATTVCIGNDSRLSNSRFPTFHTHDADQITSGTLSNARLVATSANAINNLVLRDASGNFSAGTITASLTGTASGNALSSHTHVASDITSGTLANARTTATNANTANAIVTRDASGNFSAGTITASLTGTASGNVINGGSVSSIQRVTSMPTSPNATTLYIVIP